jgi:cytochrome c-type biogenesis protein CcmH
MLSFLKYRVLQVVALCVAIFGLMGAGDDARFNAVGHKLMCVCGCNQILLECNHVGCTYSDRMRNELSAALSRGDSDDLATQAFVQKYGAIVLAAPTGTGFNRLAWITPFAALFIGLASVVLVVRTWRNRPGAPAATLPATPPAALEHFREEARKETDL